MSVLQFPVPGLADQLSASTHPIHDIATLRRAVQGAISLEFAVIPPCMTALWSIRQPDHEIAGFIHERVFHTLARVYQLANLLLAIGGVPKFSASDAPGYPCRGLVADNAAQPTEMRLGIADRHFYGELMPMLAASSVAEAPAAGAPVQTPGQFYRIIEDGLVYLEEQAQLTGGTIFETTPGYRQKTAMGYGVEGYPLHTISNLMQAHQMLRQLLGQIEGGVMPLPAPMLALAGTDAGLPEVWPLAAVGIATADRDDDVRTLMELFDSCYSQLLRVLERSFETDEQLHQRYLVLAPVLMRGLLPALAQLLMATPLHAGSDSHALPLWRYSLTSPEKCCQQLVARVADADCGPLLQQALQILAQSDGALCESV